MVNDLDKLGEDELLWMRVPILAHSVLWRIRNREPESRVPSSTAFSPFVYEPLMRFPGRNDQPPVLPPS